MSERLVQFLLSDQITMIVAQLNARIFKFICTFLTVTTVCCSTCIMVFRTPKFISYPSSKISSRIRQRIEWKNQNFFLWKFIFCRICFAEPTNEWINVIVCVWMISKRTWQARVCACLVWSFSVCWEYRWRYSYLVRQLLMNVLWWENLLHISVEINKCFDPI